MKILSIHTAASLYESEESKTIRELLEKAVKSGANLRGANLDGANLRGTNLRGANLHGADLRGADLYGANLHGADLRGANLRGANLHGANLRGADLHGANLRGTNLRGTNLYGAKLDGANLDGATNSALAVAITRILPQGSVVGWKKCNDGKIVKLRIPEEAKRSHAFGRKCRAEFADVLEIFDKSGACSEVAVTETHGPVTEYRVGCRVYPDSFNDDWAQECTHGIHFFITREEAEAYV